jgi:hypothetical protein
VGVFSYCFSVRDDLEKQLPGKTMQCGDLCTVKSSALG